MHQVVGERRLAMVSKSVKPLGANVLAGAGHKVTTTRQIVGAARLFKGVRVRDRGLSHAGLHGGDVMRTLRAAASSLQVKPVFCLHTSYPLVENKPKTLGFDGAFTRKGEPSRLLHQVGAAFRLIDLAPGIRDKGGGALAGDHSGGDIVG